MKTIALNKLEISNFKGVARLDIEFAGRNMDILGDNATGKTTVYDALTWCLFGKDSRGRADFEIKPLDSAGAVLDHGAVTSVTVALLADGKETVLSRQYREKWSMKRGGSETFDGHTTEYTVDGVPIQKKGFDAAVSELVPEAQFRMLTDVTGFCEKLSWQKRRETLFDLCGIAPDLLLMAGDKRFDPLADALNGRTVDELKGILMSKRKEMVRARDSLPARMDEVNRQIGDLSAVDYGALRRDREDLNAQLQEVIRQLAALENGAAIVEAKHALESARLKLDALRAENRAYQAARKTEAPDFAPTLEAVRQQARRYEELIGEDRRAASRFDAQIDELRRLWHEIDGEVFSGDLTCPTCGQALPPDQVEAARKKFETSKAARKEAAVLDGDRIKDMKTTAQGRIAELEELLAIAREEEADLVTRMQAQEDHEDAEPVMPGFAEKEAELEAAYREAAERLAALQKQTAEYSGTLRTQEGALRMELHNVDGRLAGERVLTTARQRLAELTRQKQDAAVEIGRIDDLLALCEEFARYKAGKIEETVNASFRVVQFRLFREQVNGGLTDCCDVTVDGVPYGSLNNAARINAGIDVIRTLSRFYGVSVPLFIDNAESVVSLADAGGQMIRLVVAGAEKELRWHVA